MDAPSIENVKLEPCCVAALEDIRGKIDAGKLLQPFLGAGMFITLMAGRGKFVSDANTAYNVATTNWTVFAQAVASVPDIVKNRCQQVCDLEAIKHHNSGPLYKFWRSMSQTFR